AHFFYNLSNRSMDVQLTDGKSELRLLSRKAVTTFLSLPEYNRFNKGLYEWIGFREKVIKYKNQVREAGKSKFGFKKSFN
ncbi:glycosyltransferase, partial [Streptococcus pyogenes]